MRRFDLTGRTLAGLLALGLILGGAPRAQAAEADTQGTALTGPAEENSIPPLLPLEPSTPEPAAPASAEQYLAALDRLLNMGLSQEEERLAVECGYWHLWRYNPQAEAEGQNPFSLDSKEPDWDKFVDFLKGEVRFASLAKMYPEQAEELFRACKDNAQWRYNNYKRLAAQNWGKDPELTPEEEALRKN